MIEFMIAVLSSVIRNLNWYLPMALFTVWFVLTNTPYMNMTP